MFIQRNPLKADKNAIVNAVASKFLSEAFEAAVGTVFVNSMPALRSSSTKNITAKMFKFTHEALEAAGGYNLLLNAIETETDPMKLNFLTDLNMACVEVATEAATRIANEAVGDDDMAALDAINDETAEAESEDDTIDTEDDAPVEDRDDVDSGVEDGDVTDDLADAEDETHAPPKKKILAGKNLQELVVDAKMTDKEYKSLSTKLNTLDIPAITDIINKKIVDAIETEKKSYQDIDAANEKLKNALIEKDEIEDDDTANEAATRVIDMNFAKDFPRDHTSLFARLQVNSATSLMMANEGTGTNVMMNVLSVSFPNIFSSNANVLKALESASCINLACMACDDPEDREKTIENASMLSTIILAFLETLNTLNLHKFSRQEVQNMVTCGDFDKANVRMATMNVNDSCSSAIDQLGNRVRCARDCATLDIANDQLNTICNGIASAQKSGITISPKVLESIQSTRELLDTKRNNAIANSCATESAAFTETWRNDRGIKNDIVGMDTINKKIARRAVDNVEYQVLDEGSVRATMYNHGAVVGIATESFSGPWQDVGAEEYFNTIATEAGLAFFNKKNVDVVKKK